MKFPLILPTTVTPSPTTLAEVSDWEVTELPGAATRLARAWAKALGPSQKFADGTAAGADAATVGVALARHELVLRRALREAFITTAVDTLSDWERMLGLPVGAALDPEVRQRRLLARWRARRGGSPQAIVAAVEALLPTGTSVSLEEVAYADVVDTVPSNVFVFAVVIADTGPGWTFFGDTDVTPAVQAVLGAMKPAHALGRVTNRVGFRCDDPASVTDLTLLGS